MRILIVIDVYGWAFEFFARGWQKYTKHQIDYTTRDNIKPVHLKYYDLFFVMNNRNYFGCNLKPPPNKTVVGVRSRFNSDVRLNKKYLGIVANSEDNQKLAQRYTSQKVHYLRSAIDHEIFTDDGTIGDKFGWSGDPNKACKRLRILNALSFPIDRKVDWGKKYFVRERPRDDQVKFYQSLRAYVHVSNSEGISQTILEAAACALPIVACDIGDNFKVIDNEHLLPLNEADCIQKANELLYLLKSDPVRARAIGLQNQTRILQDWTWKQRATEYDALMEELKNG